MLQRLVANGVSGKVTFREINEGKEQGDQYIGVSGKGTFSGTIRGVSSVAAYVAAKVTGVPYRALAKGGTYAALYDIDAQNNYKGTVVAKFAAPGLGSVCLGLTVKHGSFKPGMSFIPASGSVTIVGGTGQAARFHGSQTFSQTNVTGDAIETLVGKGLLALKMGSARPMPSACKAVSKPVG